MATADATAPTPRPARRLASIMRQPVLGPLLRRRSVAIVASVIGISQLWSVWSGVGLWECPMLRTFGVPCPGCGLSRASCALFEGHWGEMIRSHAFAPFFMVALGAFIVASVLPAAARMRMSDAVTRLERRLPAAPWLLLLMIGYYFVRLANW